MQRLPTIRQLQYLIALRKTNHFGKAAEACFVSQSAFSNAIKELESALQANLVDRSNRRVVFTPMGKVIEAHARNCVVAMEELVRLAEKEQGPWSGSLRLGVIPTIAPYLLPQLLSSMAAHYPELKLYLREGQTADIVAALNRGDIDLVLLALPYALDRVETFDLFEDPFVFACHQSSALASEAPLSIAGIDTKALILLEDGHCLREHALAACGLRRQLNSGQNLGQFNATSLFTLVQMVSHNLGSTLLPAMALPSLGLDDMPISIRQIKPAASRTIALGWRQGSQLQDTYLALAQQVQASLGDMLSDDL